MMLSSALTHGQSFLHPGQKVFEILGPGFGVEQGRLHPAVILQQGRVNFFLPWQRHLWAWAGDISESNRVVQTANGWKQIKFYYPGRCVWEGKKKIIKQTHEG